MGPAILAGSMALPLAAVDGRVVKAANTHNYLPMGAEETQQVLSYREDGEYLYVPRQYGIRLCQSIGLEYEDMTSSGIACKFGKTPLPRDYQVPVLEEIWKASQSYYDFLFRARTGFGKTIASLIFAARRGVSTLVLVDQENLKDQWLETLESKFGIPPSQVGIIQGKKCSIEGKPVSIGMIQTLAQKTLEQEVYEYFGTLLVDEVHTAGAPTFSSVLMDFSATLRMGVSATPKRRDGLQKTLDNNLGKVRVYVSDQHDRSAVHIAKNPTVYSWYANSSPKVGRYLSEIAEDGARNLLVVEQALALYESGRDTLVLGDRIEQLTHLSALAYYMGAPEEDIGVYTGQTFEYAYVKQTTPARRPEGWQRGTEYTPVELKLISRKTPKAKLKSVKDKAKLLHATYQMFAKGVDVPRLAGGIDATPRSNAEQMHGRILRVEEGKKTPIWVTIRDINSYRSIHQLVGRIADYKRNNAAIHLLHDDGSTEECPVNQLTHELRDEVERLKSARIETLSAGLHTLAFPALPTLPARKAVSATPPPRRKPVSPTGYSARAPSGR